MNPGPLLSVVLRLLFDVNVRARMPTRGQLEWQVIPNAWNCPVFGPSLGIPFFCPRRIDSSNKQVLLSIIWMAPDRMATWILHLPSDRPNSSSECILGSKKSLYSSLRTFGEQGKEKMTTHYLYLGCISASFFNVSIHCGLCSF